MASLRRNLFYTGMVTPAPLYLKLGPGSYVLIARDGEKISLADFHALQSPQSLVYMDKVNYEKVARYLVMKTSQFIESPALPLHLKAALIDSLTENAIDALTRSEILDIIALKSSVGLIQKLSHQISHFNDILERLEMNPLSRAQHGMNVALLSLMIAQEMKLNQPAVHEKLIVASLLLDLGLSRIPQEILNKPKKQWTKEEQDCYQQHPLHSVAMVKDLKDIPQDVLMIIEESHENSRGTGFPKQIREVLLSPLGKIVGLANQTLELISEVSLQPEHKSPADRAIYIIEQEYNQPFNKDCFLALKNLINKSYFAKKRDGLT